MRQPTCVISGAGGFIGKNLARALALDGWCVRGIDRAFSDEGASTEPAGIDKIIGDFRDRELMKETLDGAEVLFHLAAAHLEVNLPESEYWDVNARSVPAMLEQALQAGVRRCVHTSSVGIYGNVDGQPADERTLPKPQSIYGRSKLAGEDAALEFGRNKPIEVVVVRPAWVFGPGCPRTAKICRALSRRRFLMIGKGENLRHPIFIDDMIDAYRLAAEKPAAVGSVFNIAGERAVTCDELVSAFCQAFDLPLPPRIPAFVGTSLAVAAECVFGAVGREPPISRRTLEFFQTNNAFSIDHARSALGYEPKYSFMQGLEATRPWLEDQEILSPKNERATVALRVPSWD